MRYTLPILVLSLLAPVPTAIAERLKDVAVPEGMRENQLIGYGLVVGLSGTGDRRQTVFPMQSIANLLERMGLSVPPAAILVRNVGSVMVTAELPPFAQPGSRIDVTVAAMGDATSLQGGVLLMTGLKAANGEVYAVAQGALALGGVPTAPGSAYRYGAQLNVGRVPGGAIVERAAPSVNLGQSLRLQLRQADFTTAQRITEAINRQFPAAAKCENAALVNLTVPEPYRNQPATFMAALEQIEVDSDQFEKIVVNERTGTIVIGRNVRISPVSVMQGGLTVDIGGNMGGGSLPQGGTPPRIPGDSRTVRLGEGATVEDLIGGLAAIGATPRDVIAILQNLRKAGALRAQLEVI